MKPKISTAKLITFSLLLFFFILPALTHAQPPDFGGDDVNDVPIDGGLSLLVAAGVGYGARKLKDRKKSEKNQSI